MKKIIVITLISLTTGALLSGFLVYYFFASKTRIAFDFMITNRESLAIRQHVKFLTLLKQNDSYRATQLLEKTLADEVIHLHSLQNNPESTAKSNPNTSFALGSAIRYYQKFSIDTGNKSLDSQLKIISTTNAAAVNK